MTRLRAIKISALVIYGCFLIALSVFKTAELFLPIIYGLEDFFGGDKLMHLKLSMVLSVLALMALVSSHGGSSARSRAISVLLRAVGVCLFLIAGLFADELHQALVSTRRFEWWDFAYGISGISIGLLLFISGCWLKRLVAK